MRNKGNPAGEMRGLTRVIVSCPGVLVLGEARMATRRAVVSMPVLSTRRVVFLDENGVREMGEIPVYMMRSRVVRFCRELLANRGLLEEKKGLMDRAVLHAWFYGGLVFTMEAPEPYVAYTAYLPLEYRYYVAVSDVAAARLPVENASHWLQLAAGLEHLDTEAVAEACRTMRSCSAGEKHIVLETVSAARLYISWGGRGYDKNLGPSLIPIVPENIGIRHIILTK